MESHDLMNTYIVIVDNIYYHVIRTTEKSMLRMLSAFEKDQGYDFDDEGCIELIRQVEYHEIEREVIK